MGMSWREAPWARPPGLFLLGAITTSGSLPMHIIVPALPAAAAELGVTPATIQLTVSVYLIGLAVGQLLYGPWSDRFGRRPTLLIGLTIYLFASAAAALAPNVGVLLGARVLQSLGGCSGLAIGRAVARESAGPGKAAARLALLTFVMTVAPALAPALGGYTTAWFGWRAVFVLLAVLGFATLLAAVLLLPETNKARTAGAGPVQMMIVYGRLFRSARFCGYAFGGACSTTSIYAFIAASPFLFIQVLDRSAEDVGIYGLILLAGASVGSIAANRFAGRARVWNAARVANLLTIAGALLFLTTVTTGLMSVETVLASMFVYTLGVGAASPFAAVGSMSVYPDAVGTASGLHGSVQMVYGALCTLAVSLWPAEPALNVAIVLLLSALLGQAALTMAARAEARGEA